MNGHSTGALNPRTLGMNHLDQGSAYTSLQSPPPPSTYYSYNRYGIYHPDHRSGLDNGSSLTSSQFRQSHLDDTNSERNQSQFHFSKWCPTNSGNNNSEVQRSSSLSPKPTKSAVQLSYRPPTPQVISQPTIHRGILKGHRPPSDESPRGAFSSQSKGFWDTVDFSGDVNDSCNSIASSNTVGDSISRKTVRFADGKPAMSNRIMQVPSDVFRGSTIRGNGTLPQGIYEWEPDDGLTYTARVTGDLHKPPRPPKLRPSMRQERRSTADRFVSSLDAGGAMGIPTPPKSGSASLRSFEGPLASMDDNYANYESIYGNRSFPDGEVERIDSQRLDALMKPYMTSTNQEPTLNPSSPLPTPPPNSVVVALTSKPVYRTEVKHSPSSGGTFVGQQKNSQTINEKPTTQLPQSAPNSPPFKSTSSAPSQFVYTIKPTLVNSDIDDAFDIMDDSSAIEDATLKSRSPQNLPSTPLTPRIFETWAGTSPLSMPTDVNDNPGTVPPRSQNSWKSSELQQVPIMTQALPQSKQHQPLRIDINQVKSPPHLNGKSFMPPRQGPPFTDSTRRRVPPGGPQVSGVSSDRKTGGLDRDGVWRPNRFPLSFNSTNGTSSHAGTASPIAQGLAYPPSPYFTDLMNSGIGYSRTDRRQMRTAPRLFPFGTSIGGVTTGGGGVGGVEVPIVVIPSAAIATTTTPLATPVSPSSSASIGFRHRPMSPNTNGLRRDYKKSNELKKRAHKKNMTFNA